MATLLHASDLQYGRPYRPAVGEALQRLAREEEPDLTVVAGDLTQRAKKAEFVAVARYLEELGRERVVVTPGNHDVPLWRVWERLVDPYRNWRRFIDPELDTVTRVPGMVCVALNSAAPRRAIVAGRLSEAQLDRAEAAFGGAGSDDLRVLVTHHHFVPTHDGEGGRTLPRAARILGRLEEMGVDLVLGGHVHQTWLTSSRALVPGSGPGIPLVASGTAASSRGRGVEAGKNSVNLVHLSRNAVEVRVHWYQPGSGVFEAGARHTFRRASDETGARGWQEEAEVGGVA